LKRSSRGLLYQQWKVKENYWYIPKKRKTKRLGLVFPFYFCFQYSKNKNKEWFFYFSKMKRLTYTLSRLLKCLSLQKSKQPFSCKIDYNGTYHFLEELK